MDAKTLSALTDEELLTVAKQNKPSPLFDALFIGFMVGVLVYSAVVNSWGMVSVVPLYLIYRFLQKPKQYVALQEELARRGLQ